MQASKIKGHYFIWQLTSTLLSERFDWRHAEQPSKHFKFAVSRGQSFLFLCVAVNTIHLNIEYNTRFLLNIYGEGARGFRKKNAPLCVVYMEGKEIFQPEVIIWFTVSANVLNQTWWPAEKFQVGLTGIQKTDMSISFTTYGKLDFKSAKTELLILSSETIAYLCCFIIIFFACLPLFTVLYIKVIHNLPMCNVRAQEQWRFNKSTWVLSKRMGKIAISAV